MAKKQLTTSFQPDPTLLAALKEQAIAQDRSVSWLVNYYTRKGMEVDGILEPKEKPKKKPTA